MGIQHRNKIYIDLCPSFEERRSSAAQQRMSQAVCHIMGQAGYDIMAYVDNFCGAHRTFHQAMDAFASFEELCEELGLRTAPDKAHFPTTKLEWLGFEIDTVEMKITIPAPKLKEIIDLVREWQTKRTANRREFQSIAGKINHAAQCIPPARKFFARILYALRSCPLDNTPIAVQDTVNTGHTPDMVLAACSRELWLIAALQELRIVVGHALGSTLVLADALSRMFHSPTHSDLAKKLTHKWSLQEIAHHDFNDIQSHDL